MDIEPLGDFLLTDALVVVHSRNFRHEPNFVQSLTYGQPTVETLASVFGYTSHSRYFSRASAVGAAQ